MAKSVPILDPVELATGSNGIPAIGRCKDYAGNSFLARLIQVGNASYVQLFRMNTLGVITGATEFEMEDGPVTGKPDAPRKMVDVHIMVDEDDIVATVTGYNLTAPTRLHYQEEFVWVGVAVPFPLGVNPEMGAGPAMFRSEGGSGGGAEVDYEQIRQIVKTEVDAAKTLIIANMISKTKAALQQEKVLTQPMFAGGQGDFEVSEQLKNRSYVGSLGALKTAGLYTGPIPGEEEPTP